MKWYFQGKEVDLVPNQMYSTHCNFYWEEEGRRIIKSGKPGVDLINSEQQKNVTSITKEASNSSTSSTVNINEASFSDIRRACPALGRVAAKAIADNRPKDEGYKDFEHLLEINKSKLANVNLEAFRSFMKFA